MGGEGSGDVPGHEFHGNQWSNIISFKKSPEVSHKEYVKLKETYKDYTIDEEGGTIIGGYTGGGFREINTSLREGKTSDKIKKMENTIEKAPRLPKGIELMRGVDMDTSGKLTDVPISSIIEDKGFQSFTHSPDVALKFATSPRNSDQYVVMRLITKGNEKGISVGDTTGSMNPESEVILQRGTKLKVVGKNTTKYQSTWDYKESPYLVIDLEVV